MKKITIRVFLTFFLFLILLLLKRSYDFETMVTLAFANLLVLAVFEGEK